MSLGLSSTAAGARAIALAAALFSASPARAGEREPAESAAVPVDVDPEFVKVLEEFAQRRHAAWMAAMQQERTAVEEVTGANLDGAAVGAAMREAVDESVAEWKVKLREVGVGSGGEAGFLLGVEPLIQPGLEPSTEIEMVRGVTPPGERAAWADAVRAALSSGQRDAWEEWERVRREEALRPLEKAIAGKVAEVRSAYESTLRFESARINSLLELEPESLRRVEAAVSESGERYLQAWRARLAATLLGLKKEQYPAFEAALRSDDEGPDDLRPAEHARWWSRLPELLAPAERARWAAWQAARRDRWRKALAGGLLAQLDAGLSFSARQREMLAPLAERLLAAKVGRLGLGERYPEQTLDERWILAEAGRAEEQELQGILDPGQRRRWRELCHAPARDTELEAAEARLLDQAAAVNELAGASLGTDQEADLEAARSDFAYRESGEIRRLLLEAFSVEIGDARRAGDLPPEVVERLATAARGAVEARLAQWRAAAEVYLADMLSTVVGTGTRPVGHNLVPYLRGSGASVPEQSRERWIATIQAELTPAQRAAWEAERGKRVAWRHAAEAETVLADLDQISLFSDEQWVALEQRLTDAIAEYDADFSGNLLDHTGLPWFVLPANSFYPVLEVSKTALSAIVTPEQLEHWRAEPDYASIELSAQQFQALHAARLPNR